MSIYISIYVCRYIYVLRSSADASVTLSGARDARMARSPSHHSINKVGRYVSIYVCMFIYIWIYLAALPTLPSRSREQEKRD